jgi:hypothetical protein
MDALGRLRRIVLRRRRIIVGVGIGFLVVVRRRCVVVVRLVVNYRRPSIIAPAAVLVTLFVAAPAIMIAVMCVGM